jgi:cytochrome c-type biogenesis protein CcmH/NrfF
MRCSKQKTLMVFAGCALWLAVLGCIDWATGYELGLFAFYTAPVAVVAWNLGQGPGIIVAFIASVIWYVADRYAGDRYSTPFYGYWNTGMHFATFIINAVTFAKIKTSLDRRHELERALAESRQQVKQLTGLMLRCPQCQKPYLPEPLPTKAETFPAPTPSKDLPAALCDDCRKHVAPGIPASTHRGDAGVSVAP